MESLLSDSTVPWSAAPSRIPVRCVTRGQCVTPDSDESSDEESDNYRSSSIPLVRRDKFSVYSDSSNEEYESDSSHRESTNQELAKVTKSSARNDRMMNARGIGTFQVTRSSSLNQARCGVGIQERIALPKACFYLSDEDTATLTSDDDESDCSTESVVSSRYHNAKELLTKRYKQFTDMVIASNETGTKEGVMNSNKGSGAQSSAGSEGSAVPVLSSTNKQSGSAGGSGDDPDDPRKPRPRKEPQDKIGDDAKKELKNQEEILENLLKSIIVPSKDRSSSKEKQTQTLEEGNVEMLLKRIKLKDNEISVMQKLVNCCRNDYEELQQSFDMYKKEFEEVDKNRVFIRSLKLENATLKQEKVKKEDDIRILEEKNMKLKNKLSKMSIDCDFLRTEKMELLKKLKQYACQQRPSHVEPQGDQKKDEQDHQADAAILTMKRSSSLQEVKALKAEEDNNFLRSKIKQLESILEKLNRETKQSNEKFQRLTESEEELKAENCKLTIRCDDMVKKCQNMVDLHKFTVEVGAKLRTIYDETRHARKRLANETADSSELRRTSSNPLSVELAEAQHSFLPDNESEVKRNQNEVNMLIRSIIASMEDLREEISKTKLRLEKANSRKDVIVVQDNMETVFELNEEITNLKERFEDEEAKFKAMEYIVNDQHSQNEQLCQAIEEQKEELSNNQSDYQKKLSSKDNEIKRLKNELCITVEKQRDMNAEFQNICQENADLKTDLTSFKSKCVKETETRNELRGYLDELETENQRLLGNLTQERKKMEEIERDIEKTQVSANADVAHMQGQLQTKIRDLEKLLEQIDQSAANDLELWCHPFTVAMENGLQIFYDVTGLVSAIVRATSSIGKETTESSLQEESREQELEAMIEFLEKQNKKFQNDKLKLERKLKKTKVSFSKDTKGGEDPIIVELQSSLENLQEECKEKDTQMGEMMRQINMLQLENDTIEGLLLEAKQGAMKDQETSQCQIEKLQEQLNTFQVKDHGESKIKKLKEINKDLLQRIQLYDSLFHKEKKEQEQDISSAPKHPTDVKVPASQLHNAIKFLEKRISKLQEGKLDSERQMKVMFEKLNTDSELKKCKVEWDELDLKVESKRLQGGTTNADVLLKKNNLQQIVEISEKRTKELEECLADRTALQEELACWKQTKHSDHMKSLDNSKKFAVDKERKEIDLIKRNAEIMAHEKITSLEAQLKCRTDSEQELCDKMAVLEQRISLLEAEKLHHSRTIISMIRTLHAKEDLSKAIKARDETEKDFNKQLDEMEVIVANLKKEKQKSYCDEQSKAKYKAEYYESRDKVRKLNETMENSTCRRASRFGEGTEKR
ncbi:hypothetical protein QZH41_010280 [Actinostola sp. cb2023]|nr:hypothetical protein QZH41_010280 [Actinostola sp. cb2023]